MRIVVDYRPALRERTGVGEYVHNLVRAYTAHPETRDDEVVLFTSSWKDRPAPTVSEELRASIVDRHLPVRLLNYGWHRFGWPSIEMLAGRADVVHALHPLLIPSRTAAQVITIHDLFFLTNPERTGAEIRRDYPLLAPRHARRADAIIVPSHYTAALVTSTFSVPGERVYICSPGPPPWRDLGRAPNVPRDGYILFVGTLEPRKNVGALLDAYERIVSSNESTVPDLVLAGRATPDAAAWLDRITRAPLAGRVRHLGYVPADQREKLYAGARLLVMPSRDEGFGIPVLEAMSAGVPVIASARGSLPEVLGDVGILVDPDDLPAFEAALRQMSDDPFARACAERGLTRAREFSWDRAAAAARRAYEYAVSRKIRANGVRVV